jgi:asparagine synthase (glutamine-hydrolysing)
MDYRREIFAGLSGDRFDKQVKYELKTYLPDLLMRQDKMSMAHSIENRVPFLDHALVDASFNIPSAYLLGDGSPGQTKWLLKLLAARQWGDPFAFRNKGGFSIPVRSFFGDKQFSAYAMDKLLPGIARRGWFNGELVQKWMTNLSSISSAELEALWIMIAFEAWAAKYQVS